MECSQRINWIQKCPAQKSTPKCFPFLVIFLFTIDPSPLSSFLLLSTMHISTIQKTPVTWVCSLSPSPLPSKDKHFEDVATSCSHHFPVCLTSVSNPNPELMPLALTILCFLWSTYLWKGASPPFLHWITCLQWKRLLPELARGH